MFNSKPVVSKATECYDKVKIAGLEYAKAKSIYEAVSEKRKTVLGAIYRTFRDSNMSVSDSEHAARSHPDYVKHLDEVQAAHLRYLETEVEYFSRRQYWKVWETECIMEMSENKALGKTT